MPKQIYTWNKVKTGDIISFRYKGKKPTGLLTSIIVLNPKFPYVRKDNTTGFYLIGLKLESVGIRALIEDKTTLVRLLKSIGTIKIVDAEDEIYRVEVTNVGYLGTKEELYKKIKRRIDKYNIYRTYDYMEARKSQVFLEPIKLPKNVKEVLFENQLRGYST